jgi:hypothetical protein
MSGDGGRHVDSREPRVESRSGRKKRAALGRHRVSCFRRSTNTRRPLGQVALWYVTGGPPLDFDAPHDGQVIAHIDVLGRIPPDIARIRITNTADNAVVWDVKPLSKQSECWNRCWNLKFQIGPNQSSFMAGHQAFVAQVPQTPTFSLAEGTLYLFEAWDDKGRVKSERFRL